MDVLCLVLLMLLTLLVLLQSVVHLRSDRHAGRFGRRSARLLPGPETSSDVPAGRPTGLRRRALAEHPVSPCRSHHRRL